MTTPPRATAGRLAGAAAWNVSGKLFQFLAGLVALAVIARWVGPHAYGVFALTWVVVGLAEIFVSAAPTDTLVQRRELQPGHCNASFHGALALALLAWASIAAGADLVSGWLGGAHELAAILPLRAAILPLAAMASVPVALLMRENRFREIAAIESAGGVMGSAAGIAMAIAGAGIWSLVAMELVRQGTVTALAFAASGWTPGMRTTRAHARDLLAFNAYSWAAWGLSYADGQWPRVAIGVVLGPQALGFYALGQRLASQLGHVLMVPAYQVAMSGVARLQDDRDAVRRLVDSLLRAVAVIASPVFLGLAAVASLLVPLVFGAQWAGAVPVVQVLMWLGIRSSMSMVQMAVIRGMGRPGWQVASSALAFVATVLLVGFAVGHGLLAVCVAVVARAFLMWPLSAWFVRRLTGLSASRQAEAAAGPLFAALAMAAGTLGFVAWVAPALPDPVALASAVVFGALVYFAALPLFAPAAGRFVRSAMVRIARRDVRGLRALFEQG